MISFDVETREELDLISAIVDRARPLYAECKLHDDVMTMHMDITACHCNGCPLDLKKLLEAPDGDFGHDVLGIRRHIDRTTGKLGGCFLPRCAAREETPAKLTLGNATADVRVRQTKKGGR